MQTGPARDRDCIWRQWARAVTPQSASTGAPVQVLGHGRGPLRPRAPTGAPVHK